MMRNSGGTEVDMFKTEKEREGPRKSLKETG